MKRRFLLTGAAMGSVNTLLPSGLQNALAAGQESSSGADVTPIPLSNVRLLPSPWLEAVERNRIYLLSLEADRLLHNFRKQAGLPPKGALYGGWESDTIAGHTLGHYLSALALMYAQTDDAACRERVAYIVQELVVVQKQWGDGYVAGFTRKEKNGALVDGKRIFAEIEAGDIRSSGFDLNGAWSPLYNIHKTFAGLLDAHIYCHCDQALNVAVGLGQFLKAFFGKLTDAQMQKVLTCEYGGLNESFAELAARTGDEEWLRLAYRIYDRPVLDPLMEERDDLANRHANTQIPKLVGLARIAEVSQNRHWMTGPQFFWKAVTRHHSYVIGGNADREYFSEPDTISQHITEQTCEHCNTYNMLKLTRQCYASNPQAALFDYYERAHLNHILAAHDPQTGMFTYMTPTITAGVREWSTPTESFWCCVGTGMESHAKHGDSIWWQREETLFVNLYIPSRMVWDRKDVSWKMETGYPHDGRVSLLLEDLNSPVAFRLALRVPGWVREPIQVAVNGRDVPATPSDGYIVLDRKWSAGDHVVLDLPMTVRTESPVDDSKLVTVLRGPMVMAADLAPAGGVYDAVDPAVVTDDLTQDLVPAAGQASVFRTTRAGRPSQLEFRPFYAQYMRRSALYLRCFSESEWAQEEDSYRREQQHQKDIAARTIDVIHLGEMQQEHDHALRADNSWPLVYRGRNGRDLRSGGFIECRMQIKPGPLVLKVTVWSADIARTRGARLLVNGKALPNLKWPANRPAQFVDMEAMIPETWIRGRKTFTLRIEPGSSRTSGPFFDVRVLSVRP
ncbi:glycoside hydrolase family 127 protein [Gluconobacter morbifer]|uniref:Tat twin-arginine translocation pathway signal sequence domain protein n=1 Tax=Gluconobacter morbifer G707 TaxID=1088869 RepID=G6XLB8_9PROT|nr:glycoside hydrolase family 127 protein [Gluconobacter morbifer]EHH67546.1 tat twin-arginine translocation pathway signal sequence domain protein [Gluconobacter morbifer G707]